MKKWHKILLSILIIAVTLTVVFWPPGVKVHADEYLIMLQNYTIQPPTLDIVFNPTGTHVHRGYLNIRLDFYPEEGDKSYEQSLFEISNDEWVVSPCLTHFIKVPVDITAKELEDYILSTFYADVTATIDDIVVQKDSSHLLSPLMREKEGLPADLVTATDIKALIDSVNVRLADVSIVGGDTPATPIVIASESIDVGGDAINRDSRSYDDFTYVDLNNPANATGTIDTIDIYFYGSVSDFRVGTFYFVSGTTYHCREGSGDLGSFLAGLRQVTGLTVDIETDDLIGHYVDVCSGGFPLDRDLSGYAGIAYSGDGNYCETDDETTYTTAAGDALSLYGTGEEAGGEPSLTNTPSSKAFGVVAASSTFWSNGSEPSWPLTDGDAYFTCTNNGTIAIDITIKGTNFTGGVGWTLTQASPSENTVRLSAFKEGDGSGDNVTFTTGEQAFISSLAASADIDWELKFETGTFTDGVEKTSTITLTASAS